MYNFIIKNVSDKYEYNELIKVFLQPEDFKSYTEEEFDGLPDEEKSLNDVVVFNDQPLQDKNALKREIYRFLREETGSRPPWGILTGVRPVKLTGELFDKFGLEEDKAGSEKGKDFNNSKDCTEVEQAVRKDLSDTYLLCEDKIDLLINTYKYQQEICGKPDPYSVGIYIGIPFCPTRCLYCSFTSNQVPDQEIERYLEALKTEIRYVGKRMKETGLYPESIYIGGGTPTTLSAEQLNDLLTEVRTNMDLSNLKEFTVEAGRPDTIDFAKLEVIKDQGVERISINPQSMKEKTLELIGRSHRPADIVKAFQKADHVGIEMVNADVIAGLPEEEPEDFAETLKAILRLDPENITVHTLAVKKASKLIEVDKDFHYKQGRRVKEMLEISKEMLKDAGFRPYYLYRQKHMAGSFENVGYCKEGTPCIYNIRIMEEKQTIIALGAGGISKMYYPDENRLERVPNVSNYEIYIDRLSEMLDRKEKNIFMEVK